MLISRWSRRYSRLLVHVFVAATASTMVFCSKVTFKGAFLLLLVLVLLALFYLFSLFFYIFIAGVAPLSLHQNGLTHDIRIGVVEGNWQRARASIQGAFGLEHTFTIVGNASSSSLFELQRGTLVKRDTKIPLQSASKLVAASAVHAVSYRTNNSFLHLDDKVHQFFSWWTTDESDARSHITVHDLLAFRTGLKDIDCKHDAFKSAGAHASAEGWEQCVRDIYDMSPSAFSSSPSPGSRFPFHYAANHLTVAGLIALKAYNAQQQSRLAGKEAVSVSDALSSAHEESSLLSWDDLMHECITEPAHIKPAPHWHPYLSSGEFRFDDNPFGSEDFEYNPFFPENLGGALGASPAQYANFLHALVGGRIVPSDKLPQLLNDNTLAKQGAGTGTGKGVRSGLSWGAHGLVPVPKVGGGDSNEDSNEDDGSGDDGDDTTAQPSTRPSTMWELLHPQKRRTPYVQGTWQVGESAVHSLGLYGSLPWIDLSSDDPREHHWGLIFAHARDKLYHDVKTLVLTTVFHATLLAFVVVVVVLALELRKLDHGGKSAAVVKPTH